ncbi:MAG: tetratricopeptide repeat protein [Chloroflexales bacterium]|nr:tetratricopeptide repeat protein [Chloroflexales bacterium]
MTHLTISVLGPLQITSDNRPLIGLNYDKAQALLIYLAIEARYMQRRDALAGLFWPDCSQQSARHNLRQALTILRQAIRDHDTTQPFMLTSRETIQFNADSDHWLDAAQFTLLLDRCDTHQHQHPAACPSCAQRIEQAIALYRGPFLEQFFLPDSVAFEDWALFKREQLYQRAIQALARLTGYYHQTGDHERACRSARRQVELDPWREEAHRQLMYALALQGERSMALAQYEQCRRILAEKLGLEPEEATIALYEQIKQDKVIRPQGDQSSVVQANTSSIDPVTFSPLSQNAATAPHNLPSDPNPLFGREVELVELADLLANPDCRLVTLVGPGGIGKTRLGLRIAAERVGSFAHGICFIPLAAVHSTELLVSTIADALGVTLYSQGDPKEQLLNFLSTQNLFLLLDNFEQICNAAPLLGAILQFAPQVKILVTSRERLNVQGEWVFVVEGLSVPPTDADIEAIGQYGAVQLFLQCVRCVQTRIQLCDKDWSCIARICQLVEGMPLGIEMAAAWSAALSWCEIAQEIEHNLDFLVASLRDAPERHRSMRAVFDHSWKLLSPRERVLFRRLSVFRGGFTRDAAEALWSDWKGETEMTPRPEDRCSNLQLLSALVRKSFLRYNSTGRYEIHELLRQYGEEKLRNDPKEEQQARDCHCAYYMGFLARREAVLKGRHQRTALEEISAEMENIWAAWQWATQHSAVCLIAQAIEALGLFCEIRGRPHEIAAIMSALEHMLDHLDMDVGQTDEKQMAIGKLLMAQGSYASRIGNGEQAKVLLQQSINLLRRLAATREIGLALNFLSTVVGLQGAYTEEQRLLQESVTLSQAAADRWLTAYSLNNLAMVTHMLGNHAKAQQLAQESLMIFKQMGDQRGMAYALSNLGAFAQKLGASVEAMHLYRESLNLRRANGDQWGIATTLIQLGVVSSTLDTIQSAYGYLCAALKTALEIRALTVVLEALVELAAVLTCMGETERAYEMLELSLHSPALSQRMRERAERLLADLPAVRVRQIGALAQSSVITKTIEELASSLLETHGRSLVITQP